MDTNRLEAFSDGVFAVAITLLVFNIKSPPPSAALGAELFRLWPSYLAYVVSFLVIGAIWINHHIMFRYIARVDDILLLLNVLYLMLIAFLPFPTAVIAEAFYRGTGGTVAAALYGGILTGTGLFVNAMWLYAARGHRLFDPNVTEDEARRFGRRLWVGPLGYAVATGIALVVPRLALLLYLALNLFYLWPRRGHGSASAHAADGELPGPPTTSKGD